MAWFKVKRSHIKIVDQYIEKNQNPQFDFILSEHV